MAGWDLLLDEGRIARIARKIEPDENGRRPAAEVIDCSRHVVVPGFVNTHHHFYQTLTRNLPAGQDAKLFDWLVYHYPIWANLDEDAVRISTQLACGELLKTGCTCTTDHHYLYPDGFRGDLAGIQFHAAGELGIRFSPSRGSMSRGKSQGGLPPDSVVQDEESILKDCQRVVETYHDPDPYAMRKVTLAPCSPFSVTPDLMKESVKLARALGVRLHTHLAETADENDYCIQTHGKRPLAVMEEWGFVGSDVSYAHGVFFNDDELRLLADTGTGVSHCPSSNMRLGSGIARVSEMLSTGVPVALGVDGSASNDTSDMLAEMRNALLLQRVKYGADAISARDVMACATEGGAAMLNFPRTGAIKQGWTADLAAFDVHRLEYAGALSDPLAALLFAGINHQTDYTIVNDRVVVRHGKLQTIDEEELTIAANHAAAGLLAGR
ncbi:MAG: 8-oxoguanine deaminase [Spirochaetaceae bacterium]|nr:8-oxoguanine deaminase [Spirochaetaceae bacterium]